MEYVKYIDETNIEYPPSNIVKGNTTIINYDLNIDLLIADGYKQLIRDSAQYDYYYSTYTETENSVIETKIETERPVDEREEALRILGVEL